MKKSKRALSLLVAAAMAASLTACGGGGDKDSSASAEGRTEITFWHAMSGLQGEALQELVDDFNESQEEVFVKAEFQGNYDDTITKLKAAMQSGNVPDVCQMYEVGTQFMIDSGSIIPVEDMFESTGYDKNSIMPLIANYYTVEGKQYSMPLNVAAPILYYNKDVFEEAGLDPNDPPTTYAEILEYSKQIVESGAAPVGFAHPIYGWLFEEQLVGLGATYGNNGNGREDRLTAVDFDQNGAGAKALQVWLDLYDSGYTENYGTVTADTQTAFYSGQTAMMTESASLLKTASENAAFEIGAAAFPKVDENSEGGVAIGGASLWMMETKDEARQAATWKFIEYTTQPETQAKWSMNTGYLATNPAAYELDEMKTFLEENPNFQVPIDQLNNSPVNNNTAGVLSGVQTESRLIFNEVIPQLYEHKLTVDEAVTELAKRVNEAITNYNASVVQ